jgi:hypothetical protein
MLRWRCSFAVWQSVPFAVGVHFAVNEKQRSLLRWQCSFVVAVFGGVSSVHVAVAVFICGATVFMLGCKQRSCCGGGVHVAVAAFMLPVAAFMLQWQCSFAVMFILRL